MGRPSLVPSGRAQGRRAKLEEEERLRIEEEKRKVVVRDKDFSGPRIKWSSTRVGDSRTTHARQCTTKPIFSSIIFMRNKNHGLRMHSQRVLTDVSNPTTYLS